jgi:very-short-patch-repair endonuclease
MTWGQRPRKHRTPPAAGGNADLGPEDGRGRTAFKRARDLRTNATDAESKLWSVVRRKQISGLRFRRQFILGPYFVDFVCLPARLVVEVDGNQHFDDEQREHDRRRTAWLERAGFRVLRFLNVDVLKNCDDVIRVISEIAVERAERRARDRVEDSPGGGV